MPFFGPGRKQQISSDPYIVEGLLTLEQCMSGIAILGGTGSGKTSAVGRTLAHALLSHPSRPGFLVLSAVPEFARWQEYCAKAGRSADLIRVAPGTVPPLSMNFLQNELLRTGSVEAAAQYLDAASEVGSRQKSGGKDESPYWDNFKGTNARRAISALWYGIGHVSVFGVLNFVNSAPQSDAQLADKKWRKWSYCWKALQHGKRKGMLGRNNDFAMAYNYWLNIYPNFDPKTRAIGTSILTFILDKLLTGDMAKLVARRPNNLNGGLPLHGKVLVCDMPILHGQHNQFFQLMLKMEAQRTVLARNVLENPRPVVFWYDEPQFTLLPDTDHMVQTVARQCRLINIPITQNLPTLYAAMGSGESAKQKVDGWLGNHATKVFCNNDEMAVTNQFASDLLGKSLQFWPSGGGKHDYSVVDDLMGRPSSGFGFQPHWHPDVPPEAFLYLKRGGPPDFEVETYFSQTGARFPNGKTWLKVTWSQCD